jgi:hypothetical protein
VAKINRSRILKGARNALLSIVILLVLTAGTGVAYTWYMGQQPVKETAAAEPVETPPAPPVKKPQPAAPGAKVGASVQIITSPVASGANASITVKTNPDSSCTIKVVYDKTASTDSGLGPKKADEYGMVSWTWTVEATAPAGKWPVKVTCVKGDKSAVVQGDLKVEK